MISLKSRFTAGAAMLALAAGGLGVMGAATAGATTTATASTVGCQALTTGNGACGSVALKFGHMSLDVYKQRATYGNKVILWTKSNSDPGQDFYAAQYNHSPNQFTIEFAPNGNRSGYCVAFPDTTPGSTAVLRPCNQGPWQTFSVTHPSGSYFELENQASRLVMEDSGFGLQGTQVGQWYSNGGDNQLWKPFI